MDRQKYSNGSLGKVQNKYGSIQAADLKGSWNATTKNKKINLAASGNMGDVNRVTASYKGKESNASVTRDSYGNTKASYNKRLKNNSDISANISRPKGGGTQYGIQYRKTL